MSPIELFWTAKHKNGRPCIQCINSINVVTQAIEEVIEIIWRLKLQKLKLGGVNWEPYDNIIHDDECLIWATQMVFGWGREGRRQGILIYLDTATIDEVQMWPKLQKYHFMPTCIQVKPKRGHLGLSIVVYYVFGGQTGIGNDMTKP